jgi:hypothetical protein
MLLHKLCLARAENQQYLARDELLAKAADALLED